MEDRTADRIETTSPICYLLAMILAATTAIGGGWLVGLAIDQWGMFGSVALWPLGVVVGRLGRRLSKQPFPFGGILLGIGCAAAFVAAEVCWIHWNIVEGADSWRAAVACLPQFVRQYRWPVFYGVLFTALGVAAAHRQLNSPLVGDRK